MAWDTVKGTSPEWHKQIDSEVKEEFVKPKTQETTMHWVKRKKHNHSLDCEVYQIAAALIWGVL